MTGGIDIQNIQKQKSAGMQELQKQYTTNATGSVRAEKKFNQVGNTTAAAFIPAGDHTNEILDDKTKTANGMMSDMSEGKRSAAHEMDVVMSHMLSKEDYRQAREEGYDPSEIEVTEAVTIVDRIKAELLKSGTVIAGMNDGLSVEQLVQMTGSESAARQLTQAFVTNDLPINDENVRAAAKALARAGQLTTVSDNAIAYLIENELTPSVDHLYLAEHAAKGESKSGAAYYAQTGGYIAARADAANLTGLESQIDAIIKSAGLETDYEVAKEQAQKLIGAGISLTADHLNTAVSLSRLSFPLSQEQVLKAGACAIAMGRSATQGNLLNPSPLFEQAKMLNDNVQSVTDDALIAAVQSKEAAGEDPTKTLTIRELMQAQQGIESAQFSSNAATNGIAVDAGVKTAGSEQNIAVNADNAHLMQARLQLEEIRISMSVTANITLMRSGISIDTTPMRDLIDKLQSALQQNAMSLFGAKENALSGLGGSGAFSFNMSADVSITIDTAVSSLRLFEETNAKATYLRDEMPVGVIGALSDEFKTDTLDDIYTGATTWKIANAAYDSMQTEVRRDLGDSIKKAFRNADSLLNDLGVSVNEDSLRAVRILSYNRMEVSLENISRVTEFDANLNQVLNDLKPAAVLDLIRSGKNPLKMTLNELDEALTKQSEGRTAGDEKYARFLYKMDKSGDISSQERESFIGIYRMFETLKKTDHAAIGALLNTGADMSIKNLLTATRTLNNANGAGIDLSASDSGEGYIKSGITNAIDLQIDAAFSCYAARADSAFTNIEPEKMKALGNPEDSLLTTFADAMETMPADEALDASFDAEQTARIHKAFEQMDDAVASDTTDLLTASDLPVNTANLEALSGLIEDRTRKRDKCLWEEIRDHIAEVHTNATDFNEEQTVSFANNTNPFTDSLGEASSYADTYTELLSSLQDSLQNARMASTTSYGDLRVFSSINRRLALASHMAERGSFEIPLEKEGRMISMQVTLSTATLQQSGMTVSYETAEYGFVSASFEIRETSITGRIATTNGETPQTKRYMESVRDELLSGITSSLSGYEADSSSLSLIYGASRSQMDKALMQTQKEAMISGKKTSSENYLKLAKLFTQAL